MPRGVYKRTEEHKNKISLAHIGKKKPWSNGKQNIGRKLTEEHKRKVSEGMKGHIVSEETKRKISERNKGKPKSEEHRRKNSEAHKGKKRPPFSEETKRRMSEFWKGKPKSEEHRKKLSESHINNPNRKIKDTSIESKIEAELQRRNINYQKQVPLCKIAIVDFYLPEYRIVIQCDGDYWHNKEGAKERDERQDKVLTFNGFNVYRFWEHEINKSAEECINKIAIK